MYRKRTDRRNFLNHFRHFLSFSSPKKATVTNCLFKIQLFIFALSSSFSPRRKNRRNFALEREKIWSSELTLSRAFVNWKVVITLCAWFKNALTRKNFWGRVAQFAVFMKSPLTVNLWIAPSRWISTNFTRERVNFNLLSSKAIKNPVTIDDWQS